jgi:hypothetical protein
MTFISAFDRFGNPQLKIGKLYQFKSINIESVKSEILLLVEYLPVYYTPGNYFTFNFLSNNKILRFDLRAADPYLLFKEVII